MTPAQQSSENQWKVSFVVPSDPGFGVHEVLVPDFDDVPRVGMSVNLNLKEKGVTVTFAVIECELKMLQQEAEIKLRKWDQGLQSN